MIKTRERPKISVEGAVRVRAYEVMRRCVEEGVVFGYRRAYKYTDAPDEDRFVAEIVTGVLCALEEYFMFDDIEDETGAEEVVSTREDG